MRLLRLSKYPTRVHFGIYILRFTGIFHIMLKYSMRKAYSYDYFALSKQNIMTISYKGSMIYSSYFSTVQS